MPSICWLDLTVKRRPFWDHFMALFSQILWKSMEIYGNLWKSMEIYGNAWKSIQSRGSFALFFFLANLGLLLAEGRAA